MWPSTTMSFNGLMYEKLKLMRSKHSLCFGQVWITIGRELEPTLFALLFLLLILDFKPNTFLTLRALNCNPNVDKHGIYIEFFHWIPVDSV